MSQFLFYVEAEVNPDPMASTIKAWIVSRRTDTLDEAQALAKTVVSEIADQSPDCITSVTFLGMVDRTVFQSVGELAP